MDMQAKINLKPITRRDLQAFLAAVPESAELKTETRIIKGDRPGESDRTEAHLVASWDSADSKEK